MSAKPKSTCNDLPVSKEVTEEEAQAFQLDPHLIALMWNEPFFASIMRHITKERTSAIPTAGVCVDNGTLKLFWNPKFLAGLNASEIRGLLKHECYHLIFKHTTDRRHDPHIVWNYATDLAINSIIPEDELPEGGLIPGKAFKKPEPDVWDKLTEEQKTRFENISSVIESLPKGKASEWYFSRLINDDDFMDGMTQDGTDYIPGSLDDHEGWDNLSDEERDLIKGKVEGMVEDAVKRADQSNSWGSVSQEVQQNLREMISKEIDWRKLLKNFCGRSQRAERSTTMKRINRRYPYIHPGTKRKHTAHVAVYVDMSGSVSDDELSLLYAELNSLAKNVTFTFFPFDHSVDTVNSYVWKRKQKQKPVRYRSGGTCFKAVTKHANENRGLFDGYLILTDGYAPHPPRGILRRGWIITPDGDQSFNYPKEVVMKMKRPTQ